MSTIINQGTLSKPKSACFHRNRCRPRWLRYCGQRRRPTLSRRLRKEQRPFTSSIAGCHGTLRKGRTGKSLEPKETTPKNQKR